MRILKNQSIRTKLTLLVVLVGAVVVVVSGASYVVNVASLRRSKVQELSALAEMLAYNSTAALSFHHSAPANELLSSLKSVPTVQYACLFDNENQILGAYNNGGNAAFEPPIPRFVGHRFTDDGHLDIALPVEEHGERLGVIYMLDAKSDLDADVSALRIRFGLALAASVGMAVFLFVALHRVVSAPILRLAEAAKEISSEDQYSTRVRKRANDEIGLLYDQFNHMLQRVQTGQAELRKARDELELRVQDRTRELSETNAQLQENIAQREKAARQIEEMHQQLVESAHQAGMAEIAADVLHNVGNILNSINVSVTLLQDRLRQSELKDVRRAIEIMGRHQDDLAEFITQDKQGKHVPAYLLASAEVLESERTELLATVEILTQQVDHIKTIITTQQFYAGIAGLKQVVNVEELIDDALKMTCGSLQRHKIEVVKEIEDIPQLAIDKHRVMQILINLIKNATDAIVAVDQTQRQIRMSARRVDDQIVRINVSDNGAGISPENLAKIFSHGFTTKAHGNGFGLHGAANAAKEIGGRLTAHSDGPGRGATFALDLPIRETRQDGASTIGVPSVRASAPDSIAAPASPNVSS